MNRVGILVSRCSGTLVVSVAVAAVATAPGSIAPSTTTSPTVLVASDRIAVECRLFHRRAVTREVRSGPVIRLSNRRHTAHVRVAAFALVAKLPAEPANAVPRSLSIRISHSTTGKVIAAALYQGITNNHYGSHGFTGLLYTYAPGGAELQYFCHLRP